MRIFLGSSREASDTGLLRKVAGWIEREGHTPIRWDDPGVFPAGAYTFTTLRQIARKVDGAVFVFSEDDEVWYRTDKVKQPRDNILIEYGLFCAALGEGRVIICRSGKPKTATDLLGINYVVIGRSSEVRAEIEITSWLKELQSPDSGSLMLERLNSPFQASGKQSLFLKGTELVRKANKRVALVAKTPIVLVGCRPYDDSDTPISYEVDQLDTYEAVIARSSAGTAPDFICVASRTLMLEELNAYRNSSLPSRVRQNCTRLHTAERKRGSRTKLRWYDGSAPMTFLVSDDDFIIWFKDSSGESVWITAHNEVIARALYSRAEVMGRSLTPKEALGRFGSVS